MLISMIQLRLVHTKHWLQLRHYHWAMRVCLLMIACLRITFCSNTTLMFLRHSLAVSDPASKTRQFPRMCQQPRPLGKHNSVSNRRLQKPQSP
ncbi:hypothetical protein BDR03DRAFT_969818 [Suillus americanus]|nr:hypothetical protein BDR03DRAFT_969818 [Suillus americanus]